MKPTLTILERDETWLSNTTAVATAVISTMNSPTPPPTENVCNSDSVKAACEKALSAPVGSNRNWFYEDKF